MTSYKNSVPVVIAETGPDAPAPPAVQPDKEKESYTISTKDFDRLVQVMSLDNTTMVSNVEVTYSR